MPFDVAKDLTAVINVAAVPNVMTVNPKLPASNVKEFIATLKANPEKYAFATSGPGAEGHVAMESFKKITKTQALHVPYKGSGPALQDTLAGTTQIMVGNLPSLMPFIQSGSLKALAITGSQRLAALPNVPTYTEVGLPELNRASWFGLIVSSKTPAAIVDQLNVAANKVLADPATRAALEKIGARAEGGSAASFAAVIKEEMIVQHDIVKFAKITAD